MELSGKQDIEQILIVRYNSKTNKVEDITDKVMYLRKTQTSYYISFKQLDNSLKGYNFKLTDINIYNKSEQINVENKTVIIENSIYDNCNKILKFGPYYKIFLINFTLLTKKIKIINKNNLQENNLYGDNILQQVKIFNYYKELASYSSQITNDESSIEKRLFDLYLKTNKLNEESSLIKYLNNKCNRTVNYNTYIYPYGLNLSQKNAIKEAFNSDISIIEGPPGTGKTQTILNIISNCIVNNKKIAVISNNNTAVNNVFEKLQEKGIDFICAFLGNSDNVDKFFEMDNESKLKNFLKSFYYDTTTNINYYTLTENLTKIEINLKYQNELVNYKRKLDQIILEEEHFLEFNKVINLNNKFNNLKLDNVLQLKILLLNNYKFSFLEKLFFKGNYGISYKTLKKYINHFLDNIDGYFYQKKKEDLNKQIEKCQKYLIMNSYDELLKKQINISLTYLYNYLYKKFKDKTIIKFNRNNYRNQYNNFINQYPVVLSTTHSLLRNIGNNFMFDMLVIDEASQSDIMTSILTFNIAKQVVIVGDSKQLPQIDNQNIYLKSDELVNKYKIPLEFQYKDNSILSSVKGAVKNVPITLLKEHYRCEPRIIEFCNKKYYNQELIIMTNKVGYDSMICLKTVPGNHARTNPNGTGQYNIRELDEIISIIEQEKDKDIGIITPFRYQAKIIGEKLKEYSNIEVDTVHRFQGRQKDIIILSTVVNDLYSSDKNEFVSDFVSNDKLLNVAISRAKGKLYLIVSDKVYLSKNNSISELIQYIKYNFSKSSLQEGKVTSIFDMLYKDNYSVFSNLYKKLEKVSDVKTENLVYKIIDKVLLNYDNLKVLLHVRLSHLVNNYEGFNE